MRLSVMSINCPKCHESNVHRSHRRSRDFVPRLFGMIAVRCNLCDHRFFRPRRALGQGDTTRMPASSGVRAQAAR